MTIALKKNVPGFRDANGVFRPIRSASYVGGGTSRRKATARDRKKYSRAKAGDLGKAKQERALEAPWDREFRLEQEAKAAEKREQDRITRQLEKEIYGETSGRTSRGKGRTLAQFVRGEGGIRRTFAHGGKAARGKKYSWDAGEIDRLSPKETGTTGLTTSDQRRGKTLDYMYQAAREAGYDVESSDDLISRVEDEIGGGKATYSTHGSMTYNPAISEKEFKALLAETRRLASRRKNGVIVKNPVGWFRDVAPVTPEAVKKLYKTLATQYHPDKPGGDLRSMQEINSDYAKALKMAISGEGNTARADAERKAAVPLREAIEFAVTLPESVNVVIRGLWLWLEGGTFAAKDQIKAFQSSDGNRFKWASKKKAWFFAAVPSANKRGEMSFDDIDRLHGRELVNERKRRMSLKGNPASLQWCRCGHEKDYHVRGKCSACTCSKFTKNNPDLLSMFANAAVGIASTLQIKEMVKTRKRKAAPKKRGTTKAKANPAGKNYTVKGTKNGRRVQFFTKAATPAAAIREIEKYQGKITNAKATIFTDKMAAAWYKDRGYPQANPSARTNPSQPNLFKRQPKGELYVLTIGSGDDLISVYLHDGDKDGFSKRFKTMTAAKAYATRNKVKMVENPKQNGIIKRAWARSRAASEYRRELRLEAAAERSRARRRKAEAKAKANPALSAGETQVIRAIGPHRIGTPFAANASEASRERIIASLRKKGLLTANGALTSEGYSVANKLKKNPRRSASGKTTVARAANGKKAVARSAKANSSTYTNQYYQCKNCGHPANWHDARNGDCQIKDCECSGYSPVYGKQNPFESGDYVTGTTVSGKRITGKVTDVRWNETAKIFVYKLDNGKVVTRAKQAAKPKTPARKNPRSTARRRTFEMFQGRKVTTARPMMVSNHAPANLDALGDLVELKIAGGPSLKFNGKGTKLCAANGKLWIAGKRFAKPNPAAAANELNPIGEIDHVVYGTYKPHHGDHDYTHYIHKLGEESGKRPILCVDREGFPVIRGGNYKIEARGIVD